MSLNSEKEPVEVNRRRPDEDGGRKTEVAKLERPRDRDREMAVYQRRRSPERRHAAGRDWSRRWPSYDRRSSR